MKNAKDKGLGAMRQGRNSRFGKLKRATLHPFSATSTKITFACMASHSRASQYPTPPASTLLSALNLNTHLLQTLQDREASCVLMLHRTDTRRRIRAKHKQFVACKIPYEGEHRCAGFCGVQKEHGRNAGVYKNSNAAHD